MSDKEREALIDEMCALIKAADDAAADNDYMLDSDDCISVLRGTWKSPLTNDFPQPARAALDAPVTQPEQAGELSDAERDDLARQFWSFDHHSFDHIGYARAIEKALKGKQP